MRHKRNSIYESIETKLYLLNNSTSAGTIDIESDSDEIEPPTEKAKMCFDYYESDDDNEDVFDDEAKKEMERYKRETKLDPDSCPLVWWKMHYS